MKKKILLNIAFNKNEKEKKKKRENNHSKILTEIMYIAIIFVLKVRFLKVELLPIFKKKRRRNNYTYLSII